jgi:glycosyltransferase involved in cell wall biosynthesis
MNKIMEYMALKKPIVQFDLKEGKFSAKEASLYAIPGDTIDFANKIMYLLDNENIRKEMGDCGYNRVKSELSWEFESKKLIDFYSKISSN